jgi:hypothetical protein
MAALHILFLFCLLALPAERLLAGPGEFALEIEVADGDWGSAAPADIRSVLHSTAAALLADGLPAPALIRVVPSAAGPRVLFERGPRGEYVVEISARDRRWARFAYQFGHELCHIVSHFEHKPAQGGRGIAPNQWFEEALCEAASIATLRRLATQWETDPPHPHWGAYAPAFLEFAEALASETHRTLPEGMSLAQWYEETAETLRDHPYHRNHNEAAAAALLPLFESTPGSWSSLDYLNRDAGAVPGSLAEYLAGWYRAAPERHRPFIETVAALIVPHSSR